MLQAFSVKGVLSSYIEEYNVKIIRTSQKNSPLENITPSYAVGFVEAGLRRLQEGIMNGKITFKHDLDKVSTIQWLQESIRVVDKANEMPPLDISDQT